MAARSQDVYARIGTLDRFVSEQESLFARDLADQFDRVNTKMTVAMERLAVIVAEQTHWVALSAVMLTISFLLLRWARRQGWW